jgi:hypothetical protein
LSTKETRVNKTNLVSPEWWQLEKAAPGAYCPHYDRLSDVARAELAEALRMSLPPFEEIPEGIVELRKRLNNGSILFSRLDREALMMQSKGERK